MHIDPFLAFSNQFKKQSCKELVFLKKETCFNFLLDQLVQFLQSELENIEEALLRCLRHSQSQLSRSQKSKNSPQTQTLLASIGNEVQEELPITLDELIQIDLRKDIKRFYRTYPRSNSFHITDKDFDRILKALDEDDDVFPGIPQNDAPQILKRKRTYANSMVEMSDLKKIYNELWEQDRIKKYTTQIKVSFQS